MVSNENLNNSCEVKHNVVSNFDDSLEDESTQNMSNGDECSEHTNKSESMISNNLVE